MGQHQHSRLPVEVRLGLFPGQFVAGTSTTHNYAEGMAGWICGLPG